MTNKQIAVIDDLLAENKKLRDTCTQLMDQVSEGMNMISRQTSKILEMNKEIEELTSRRCNGCKHLDSTTFFGDLEFSCEYATVEVIDNSNEFCCIFWEKK